MCIRDRYGTDAAENTHERLAYIDSYIIDSAHGSEAAGIRFYVAENDATNTLGLQILGQPDDNGEVDVTIGAGAASTTTIAGTLTMGSTAAMTNAGLLSVANQSSITGLGTISSGTWEATDVAVAHGGTGASSLTANAVLTGNGTSAIQAETDLLFASNKLIPTASAHDAAGTTLTISAGATTAGTSNNQAGGALTFQGGQGKGSGAGGAIIFQVANEGGSGSSLNALATALTINDDSTITTAGAIELGHASDTTLARSGSGDLTIEGNAIYRAGGTDVAVADGGTGASSLTDGGVLLGSGTGAITAMTALSDGEMIVGDGSTDPVAESGATLRTSIGVGTGDTPQFTGATLSSSSANEPLLTITNTHADATSGIIKFIKDPGSGQGADNDTIGTLTFYGTDASNNAAEELARMEAYVIEADHGSEAGGIKFSVAENDATMTAGLQILGVKDADGEIDVTIGAGAASTTTIAGTLTMGSTAAMTNAGLVSVANQSNITGVGTISSGTWEATDVAVAHGGTGQSNLNNLITMGTHTTGNYVATVTAGTGLTSTGATSGESIAHGLSVDAAQTGITSLGTQAADFKVGNGYGVVIGDATQETVSIGDGATDLVPELQVLGTAAADSSLLLAAFSTTATTAGSPIIAFAKGGNATLGSHTVVTDGEELGNIIAFGDDGSDRETPAASIQFEVDGTPGSGDMPGRIILGTTADGATAVTEAVRIDASQNTTFAGEIRVAVAASAADDGIANTTGKGLVATMRAVDGIAVGELLHIDANGDLDEAHADAAADMPAIGIALSANASGSDANIQVLLQGFYRDDSQFGFTPGAAVYVDHGTEGNFQQTPSTTDGHFIQRVGIAVTDDMIYFSPSMDVIERD